MQKQKLLEIYQRRLTNLSGKNRSLWLPKIYTTSFLDLNELDFLLNKPAFSVVESLISYKKSIPICATSDARDAKTNQISRQLKGIQRKTNSIFEESGAYDLYVGFPFVEGKLHDDTVIRCPLMFFPVRLEISNRKWQLSQRTDAGISFNKTLLLAYSHFNETEISESVLEESFDEFPKNALEFLTYLYNYLEKSEVEINFNQEIFTQKLLPFFSQTKQDASNLFETGKLKLVTQAVLGLFPQAGSYLYQDYEKLIQDEKTPPLEDFFHGDFDDFKSFNNTEFKDEILKNNDSHKTISEEEIFAPFALDASQEEVLKAVKNNNSFVVQGPPGTGKSQLICNLVSDFVAQGKKVLVVCQKRAALDVVQNRLNEIGIADFIALVHDFKQDRKAIYEQILKHIQNLESYEKQNQTLNAIHLERNFLKISREIDSLSSQFEEYRKVFFNEEIYGKSIKELYLNADKKKKYVELSKAADFYFDDECTENIKPSLSFENHGRGKVFISKFRQYLKSYIRLQNHYDKPNYILSERQSFSNFDEENKKEILALFIGIPNFKKNTEAKISKLLGKSVSYEKVKKWAEKIPQWQQAVKELQDKNLWQIFKESRYYEFEKPDWLSNYIDISEQENIAASYANAEKKWLSEKEKDFLSYFSDGGMEKFLERRTLKEANFLIEEYKKQKQNFFRKIWKRLASPKAEKFSKEFLEKYRRKDTIKNLDWLLKKISKRNSYELKMIGMQAVEWVAEPPSSIGLKKNELKKWFVTHRKALDLKLLLVELIEYSRIFLEKDITHQDLSSFLEEFVNILTEIDAEEKYWVKYLTENQIQLLLKKDTSENQSKKLDEIKSTIDSDFDKLVELDTLKSNFTESELKTIEELKNHIQEKNEFNEIEILTLFDNSIQISLINELEKQFPILKTVNSQNWQENEERLKELVAQKQQISADILRLKIKERTYKNIEYNRLGNRTTYRELEHQVKKKRSIWALRKLLSHFSEDIFELLPCWLASPETVSAIFPLVQNFDLVIFDEASQCFAEKGIPALYRGKQSIIAGDEKQLPPHDLYQPRWEEDLEKLEIEESEKQINENPALALEVDSLLDLGKNYLPSFWLNGHYRSRFAELIAFSNYHFYQNKLKIVPDLKMAEEYKDSMPLEYIKVSGVWNKNQNLEEAEKVVELVEKLLQDEKTAKKSIGIITFNAKQQNLIRDLLEENIKAIPESLFIKNIENVQGDERDLIIFSVGYAPNMSGKFRLNFGSLSQAGGENRLNVAISRAREKIFVVSSIFPHQLPVLETHSLGAQLLKKYLSFTYEISEGKSWHQINFDENNSVLTNGQQTIGVESTEQNYFSNLKNIIISTNQNSEIEFSQNTFSVMDLVMLSKTRESEIIAAIYTDDERYFASYSAKEFHVYLPVLLEKKGWKVKFYWSREYFSKNYLTD
ncbi:AAA domain-containing protein [Bernardetia sp.]|uniref:AAA domain-containing protein n=1 Tax=Bernardetia sp. TaxID=1937974 RepID=UPI0025BBCA87|nr:AAA domain-containing protein [Bernardetia sp.]